MFAEISVSEKETEREGEWDRVARPSVLFVGFSSVLRDPNCVVGKLGKQCEIVAKLKRSIVLGAVAS